MEILEKIYLIDGSTFTAIANIESSFIIAVTAMMGLNNWKSF